MNEIYTISFQIISDAGDARSYAMKAMTAANNYEFEEANNLLLEAKVNLKKAHKVQTKLLQKEANEEEVTVNVILIHAQDHFSMAMCAIDMAEQAIFMNKRIYHLERG